MYKKFNKDFWRFHFFDVVNEHYCFDSFTHKIIKIHDKLLGLLEIKDFKEIKKEYTMFYNKIINKRPFKNSLSKDNKCYVTINISNKCNLNCTYCYRKKTNDKKLSNNDLLNIIKYVKTIYAPNASEYAFSLCYTSESSLDLDQLKYFDYLIGETEGFLFSKKQISIKKAEILLKKLPPFIREKYKEIINPISKLNEILRKEKLWKYFDYSDNEYLKSVFSKTQKLSYSRTIVANRQILNKVFSELKIEKKVQYCSISFMTNGTNITDEYISFIKSILLYDIYVSIDGPEEIHNKNRVFINGEETFSKTVDGIKKLQMANINVIPSVVITPTNCNLNNIVSFFSKLNFSKISFNLVRGTKKDFLFTKESIDILLYSIRNYLNQFYLEFQNKIVSKELVMLKNTIIFSYLKQIYYRTYINSRCTWGKDLVIDSSGNLYHCNSTIGFKEDCIGHYSENKKKKKIQVIPDINSTSCKYCYAKYLCGGTCYAEKIMENKQNEKMECYFHKELINQNLEFYAKLYSNSLLDDFMKVIV